VKWRRAAPWARRPAADRAEQEACFAKEKTLGDWKWISGGRCYAVLPDATLLLELCH
jgi:hypothetical protein